LKEILNEDNMYPRQNSKPESPKGSYRVLYLYQSAGCELNGASGGEDGKNVYGCGHDNF
jgi:hypothetical protein